MVMLFTGTADPRSTRHHLLAPPEHHLSARPPDPLPLTALPGVSFALQLESAVAGLPSARFDGFGHVVMPGVKGHSTETNPPLAASGTDSVPPAVTVPVSRVSALPASRTVSTNHCPVPRKPSDAVKVL